ncbi:Fis family transcriptional regulator [Labrys monachus]|uniref:Folylpolyglutamate synthase/dihydropteroate synthase n=1 Tax=Labrys monachus TaxID=217067 RepID=A0ABU0FP90_9HYPH|nr:Fis family transcriptional regulator [Labrys monachus]MDQ0396424.1 folylpolyglutamate synthase/dihydropteroate synthase [Labrys monachus]
MTGKRIGKHIGSSFDDFLKEEGIHEEAVENTARQILAWQIREQMIAQGISKVDMAKRMETSRAQLDHLLDPEDGDVNLRTVQRAAAAVGKKLRVELV